MSEKKLRSAIYLRVSSSDQNCASQEHDLRQMAQQRGWEIVARFVDHGVSGARERRPGLDALLAEARRGQFDVVACWASDRLARSTVHFLRVLEQLKAYGVGFASFREPLDSTGPLGEAVLVIIGVVAQLERSLIAERVKAGLRRARLEGRRIGRKPLELDREQILEDRRMSYSLKKIAKIHGISKTTVQRILAAAAEEGTKTLLQPPSAAAENKGVTPAF